MKKLLAILLLLVLPACALAEDTFQIFNVTDNAPVYPDIYGEYKLSSGKAYTMSGSTTHSVLLRLIASPGGTVVLSAADDVSIQAQSSLALSIHPSSGSNNASLQLNLNGKAVTLSGFAGLQSTVPTTISGSGSLTATAAAYGISLSGSSMTIQGGAQVTASSSNTAYYAVFVSSGASLTVQGEGTQLKATASGDAGNGIEIYGRDSSNSCSMIIRDGAAVIVDSTGKGNFSMNSAYGLEISGYASLTVESDGNFEASSVADSAVSNPGAVTVKGSGRYLAGKMSETDDWAEYEYGMKYAKVLPEYVPVPGASDLPETGDPSTLSAWACLMLASLAALGVMRRRVRG